MAAPDGVWKVKYSTARDQHRRRPNFYDGMLHFWSDLDRINLLNAKGESIVGRSLENGDSLLVGSNVRFPSHTTMLSQCISVPMVRAQQLDMMSDQSFSLSMHEAVELGMDFSFGSCFQLDVKRRFRSTVHPLGKPNHFIMVVSFGRAKFKLDETSAGLALKSCIGGLCHDLHVMHLGDRIFRFSVASKHAGFMVYSLKSFACPAFKCFFHLWGNGGPSWKYEFKLWQKECDEEWVLVSPNKKRIDHALRVLKQRPTASAFKKNIVGVQRCLSFAAILEYPACPGYEYSTTQLLKEDLVEAGYVCTQLGNRPKVVFAAALTPPPVEIQFGSISTPPRVQLADQRNER
jgi:hypothetical protein